VDSEIDIAYLLVRIKFVAERSPVSQKIGHKCNRSC
jgi:hypothetical protein